MVFIASDMNKVPVALNYTGWKGKSAVIVTDDYLCYKEAKSRYNFFLILIFNELFKFKTSDEWQR